MKRCQLHWLRSKSVKLEASKICRFCQQINTNYHNYYQIVANCIKLLLICWLLILIFWWIQSTLSKLDTSLRRTPRSNGHLEFVPAYIYCLYLTLYKTDITLRQTLSRWWAPKMSVLDMRVYCSQVTENAGPKDQIVFQLSEFYGKLLLVNWHF